MKMGKLSDADRETLAQTLGSITLTRSIWLAHRHMDRIAAVVEGILGAHTGNDVLMYEQTLRADRAELALADAQRKLALVLAMVDGWDEHWGEDGIKATVAASAIRRAVRGVA